jgi:hypothetical protein
VDLYYDFDSEDTKQHKLFVLTDDRLHRAMDQRKRFPAVQPPNGPEEDFRTAYLIEEYHKLKKDPQCRHSIGVWYQDHQCRGQWALSERIPVPFLESFHVEVRHQTYYFITDSGKVYIAPPVDKGPRQLKLLWHDAEKPLRALLRVASTNRVFLFGHAPSEKGKVAEGYYFELSERPQPRSFRCDTLRELTIRQPLRGLLQAVYLLHDHKMVKLPLEQK